MQLCGSLSILCSRLSGLFLIQQIGTTGRKGFFLSAVNIFHDCSFSLLLSHYVVSDCFLTPWTGASFLLPRSSQPRDQTFVSYFGKWVLYYWASREALDCSTYSLSETSQGPSWLTSENMNHAFVGVRSCPWPDYLSRPSLVLPLSGLHSSQVRSHVNSIMSWTPITFASSAFLLYLLLNIKTYPVFRTH